MSSSFTTVTAPGLPTWPRLLFDAEKKRAIVAVRLATWRSWAYARMVSTLLAWSTNLLVGWWLWHRLGWISDPIGRGSLTFFGFSLAMTITKPLFPAAFDGFLARQVFPSRSTVWFTPERIAFRSRLYDRGIVLWRQWNGRPVQTRFDVTPDPEAAIERSVATDRQRMANRHVQTASLLRVIVRAFDPHRTVSQTQAVNLARAVPMLAVDLSDAARVTVVLSAAAAMTARSTASHQPSVADGQDIDSPTADTVPSKEAPHGID
ncbi:hypothetical protein Pan44_51480 [Caulifigura coniformis]|uniref:Uncharacterized protein n=1 Tax=Caulifigura coniformis TaxID=2527983 RepID=A0A517SLS9_9PLAN|nr:hypothetical protein [Caulifigura coniformis]QDT57082.1 hypothetical protein Pan44_51480 [Caulifigura coniformis]